MLNRHLIRIKVFKVLYSFVSSASGSLPGATRELLHSCEKTLHLYYMMLNLSVALKRVADDRIEKGLRKFNPTPEEREPNRRFSDNAFIKYLISDTAFVKFCEDHALLWREDLDVVVRKVFAAISGREYYRKYMSSPESSADEDCRLVKRIYRDTDAIEENELLLSSLEDMSLYWTDDIGYVLMYIIHTVDAFSRTGSIVWPEVFQKDDDRHSHYYTYEWTWAYERLEEFYGVRPEDMTALDVIRIVQQWKEAVVGLDRMLYEDARKEFSLASMTGFGADGSRLEKEQDFEQVRGDFESNPFVTAVLKHIEVKTALGDELIGRMQQVNA